MVHTDEVPPKYGSRYFAKSGWMLKSKKAEINVAARIR
jgi:hypothetical protein